MAAGRCLWVLQEPVKISEMSRTSTLIGLVVYFTKDNVTVGFWRPNYADLNMVHQYGTLNYGNRGFDQIVIDQRMNGRVLLKTHTFHRPGVETSVGHNASHAGTLESPAAQDSIRLCRGCDMKFGLNQNRPAFPRFSPFHAPTAP